MDSEMQAFLDQEDVKGELENRIEHVKKTLRFYVDAYVHILNSYETTVRVFDYPEQRVGMMDALDDRVRQEVLSVTPTLVEIEMLLREKRQNLSR